MVYQPIDPAVQEAAKKTADNQAQKEALALQAQQISVQAAASAAGAQQAADELKSSESQAELERLNRLKLEEKTQQGWTDDRAFRAKENQLDRDQQDEDSLFELKKEKLDYDRNKNTSHKVNNMSKAYSSNIAPLAAAFPGTPEEQLKWGKEINDRRRDYEKGSTNLILESSKAGKALGRSATAADESVLDFMTMGESALRKKLRVGGRTLDISSAHMRRLMDNPEALNNILFTIDEQARGGGWSNITQEIEDTFPGFGWLLGGAGGTGGIHVPPGTAAESLPLYDEIFGATGVLAGVTPGFDDLDNQERGQIGMLLSDVRYDARRNHGEQVGALLRKDLKGKHSQKYIDELVTWAEEAGQKGDMNAWEESLVGLQGVTQEDYYRGSMILTKKDAGLDLTQDEKAFGYWFSETVNQAGWNPLMAPDAIEDVSGKAGTSDYTRPFSTNPYGQEEIIRGKANSGDVSLGRYVGHLATEFNSVSPGQGGNSGMGDSILSIYHAIGKYKDGGKTTDGFDKLQKELTEIGQRDGAHVYQVFDALADSWGSELQYVERGDVRTGSNAVVQQALDAGWNVDKEGKAIVAGFEDGARGLQTSMTEFGGIWNAAIGGGYGGTDSLLEGGVDAAISKYAGQIPKVISGYDPSGAPIYSRQLGNEHIDKVIAAVTKGLGRAFEGAPQEIQDEIAAGILEKLDASIMSQNLEDMTSNVELLETLEQDKMDLERTYDDEMAELLFKQGEEGIASQEVRDQEYEDEFDKLVTDTYGDQT